MKSADFGNIWDSFSDFFTSDAQKQAAAKQQQNEAEQDKMLADMQKAELTKQKVMTYGFIAVAVAASVYF